MTDFNNLKKAAEEIKLDDLQKQRIIEACKGQKRKRINTKAIIEISVAAALMIMFLPTLFHIMNPAKSAESGNFCYSADIASDEEVKNGSDDFVVQESATGMALNYVAFDAPEYRELYSVVPKPFYELVGFEKFNEWAETVKKSDGMAIVQFIKHFGITKEEFDSANQAYFDMISEHYNVSIFTDNIPVEGVEVFNSDIIFSGDDEKIKEYYSK